MPAEVVIAQIPQFLRTQNLADFVLRTQPYGRQELLHSSVEGAGVADPVYPLHGSVQGHNLRSLQPEAVLLVSALEQRVGAVVVEVVEVDVDELELLRRRRRRRRNGTLVVLLLVMVVVVVVVVGPPVPDRTFERGPEHPLPLGQREGIVGVEGHRSLARLEVVVVVVAHVDGGIAQKVDAVTDVAVPLALLLRRPVEVGRGGRGRADVSAGKVRKTEEQNGDGDKALAWTSNVRS